MRERTKKDKGGRKTKRSRGEPKHTNKGLFFSPQKKVHIQKYVEKKKKKSTTH